MVLTRTIIALAMAAVLGLAAPAAGHENRQREQVAEAARAEGAPAPGTAAGAMEQRIEVHAEAEEDARPRTFFGRLTSWLGRTHPFAVHFPIALFPVALVALVLARRRGRTVELIRVLIIVAGAASVIAASLGWLAGGFPLVDTDPIQLWHRWIGTALGLIGGAVMVRAWRGPDAVDRASMAVVLGLITVIALVQGWLGGAIVHGMEHMQF